MPRIALAAAVLLALTACDGLVGGTASDATPQQRAIGGCASGRSADFLHQNRPGGSDFSATRCSAEGY